jgi:hypothetical protein
MLCVLALFAPVYVGVVWLLARAFCHEPAHRATHLVAAAAALAAAAVVGTLGVPFLEEAELPCAFALLAIGPWLLPLRRFRAGIAAGLALVVLYAIPFARAEYLTATLGDPLRAAFSRAHPDAPSPAFFGVLTRDGGRARALRVDEEGGYYVGFERTPDGAWRVRPGAYPPQRLAWYEGNSGSTDCPYPVPLLLIAHGVRFGCGL